MMVTEHHQRLRKGEYHARLHNEIVFRPRPVNERLPASIEAFFLLPSSSAKDAAKLREAHSSFEREYGVQVPLLLYDAAESAPFALLN